jgi:replicative DNA helicase
VTLINALRNRGVLEKIGGIGYLSELIEMVPINRNYLEYCQIVHEKAVIRNLIHTATQILEDSYGQYDNIGEVIDRAEQEIFKVSQGRRTGDFQSIQETLSTTLAQIEAIESKKGKLTGIETGFTELNHITSGLQPSDLIIVAARPSMGKTAFALNIARWLFSVLKCPRNSWCSECFAPPPWSTVITLEPVTSARKTGSGWWLVTIPSMAPAFLLMIPRGSRFLKSAPNAGG